ncbi:MAG: glycoside hydrolase family 99-like domain-containing protein [Candidatus Omnitrophica bacterium]|nr:glycoside hydrolase family 99-like domain-containing protein [Candidatus Omnitrophota bacterium]
MAKIIAMYFPQFHTIPENDRWWGKGFTDWVNVRKARPQFDGHEQPRVPLDGRYYDQSDPATLRWQTDLARAYGVHGFCHYHYWFEGKQLLNEPTDLMLDDKSIDFPFCLSWANETWSRKWDGQDHHILVRQTHIPEKGRWKRHFDYLIRAWTDERAICVDGRPVFIIYRPHHILNIDAMLDYWREEARRRGLKGLYFIAQKQYRYHDRNILRSFDAVFQFNPFEAFYFQKQTDERPAGRFREKLRTLVPRSVKLRLNALKDRLFPKLIFHDYEQVWSEAVNIRPEPGITTYPGGFVDWDNTARYKNRAQVFRGASPERFEYWMRRLVGTMKTRQLPEDYIFLNAWNEWAEAAYLEPDEKNGYRYLRALKRAVSEASGGLDGIGEGLLQESGSV